MRKARIVAEPTPFDYTERFALEIDEPLKARTLGDYFREFGDSWVGEIEDPFGIKHVISLEPLSSLSNSMYIRLVFEVLDPGVAEFGNDFSDAVVVKEYEVPDEITYA
ncbi:hypothetical protein [Nocardia fluminea]|uniref:hypothetical protein n=1 Tax=Nocardia fluminea TaxID=134984 RepID=UPI00344237C5